MFHRLAWTQIQTKAVRGVLTERKAAEVDYLTYRDASTRTGISVVVLKSYVRRGLVATRGEHSGLRVSLSQILATQARLGNRARRTA